VCVCVCVCATTCQSAAASFEESRIAEPDRKRAARKQQVMIINTTGIVRPCDRCSRTCSSRIRLFAHRRTHPSVTQSVVFDGALHVCVCVCAYVCAACLLLRSSADMANKRVHYYFASAAVAVDSSHMTASSSASWSRFSPPSNLVNRRVSTMWFMVCRWPQSQKGDQARPHLCKLARHGP